MSIFRILHSELTYIVVPVFVNEWTNKVIQDMKYFHIEALPSSEVNGEYVLYQENKYIMDNDANK